MSSGLQQDAEVFRLLVDAVEEYAIFLLDADGCVASWNRGAEAIKGYSADEIIGRHFSAFYTADDQASGRPESELKTAVADGQVLDEGWRLRKDGSKFWATVTITALRDGDGELLGFAKVTRDQTERRDAQLMAQELELLADRERIAKDLQHSVINRCFGVGLLLAGAVAMIENDEARSRVESAIEELDQAIRDARRDILGLDQI